MGLIKEGDGSPSCRTSSATKITSATWTSRSADPGRHRDPDGHQDPGPRRRDPEQALEQAREGRLHILGKMLETLAAPREEIRSTRRASRRSRSSPTRSAMIIGPGGKTIKGIVDQTGVAIDVEDDGTVNIARSDGIAVSERDRHHQGPHGRSRGRRHVHRHREAHGGLRRVRRDLPGHRRPAAHQRDGLTSASRIACTELQGRRRDA